MSSNYDYDDYEYRMRREKRQREVIERRRARKRKQKIKRLIAALAVLVVAAGLIIFLIVMGIKAIIKAVKKDEPSEIVKVEQLDLDEAEDDESADEGDSDNDILSEEEPVGISHFEVKKTDSTYYISSENTQSTYAILIDAETGEVICQKEGFTRIYPASMTKIMTALVAAEHLSDEDLSRKVTITAEDTYYAYKHDLSAVGWDNDEVVTVEDLFYGTILHSGADAAIALAKYVAGDEESFIDMMNDKVKELGLTNTHFTNCVGSYNDNHYTTCAEMAIIMKAAIENDYVYKVMNAHKYNTSHTAQHPDGIDISNWFLRRIEDKDSGGEVMCAKTGYVHQSGSCAASYAVQRSGHPYICVTGDAHSAWRAIYDHVDIYLNNAK